MNLDYYSTLKLIKALASNASLSLQISNKCKIPYTDGKQIVLPPKTNHDSVDWEYMAYHEIRHNSKGKDMFELIQTEKVNMRSFLGSVLNIIEDFRIEYIDHDEYKGEEQVLKPARATFLRKQMDPKLLSEDSGHDKSEFFKAMFSWDAYVRSTYNHYCSGIGEEIKNLIPKKANEYLQKLLGYESSLLGLSSAEECYQLALDIIEDLGLEEDPEQTPKQTEQESESSGQYWSKYADLVIDHNHGDENYSTKILYEEKDFEDTSYRLSPGIFRPKLEYPHPATLIAIKAIPHTALGNNVRKLLQVKSKTINEYGKKRGRLDKKALHKVVSGSNRIFKNQIENFSLDVAVSLLVDCSGSMAQLGKFPHAARASCMLNDALGKIRIPVEISGFSESHVPIDIRFKQFGETIDNAKLEERFSCVYNYMENNADGESILLAYDRIKTHKARRKIIIVLSDGMPSAIQRTIAGFTKKVISSINNEGVVEVYGMGIMDDSVKLFYGENCVVIQDSSELESKLLEVIKKRVIK